MLQETQIAIGNAVAAYELDHIAYNKKTAIIELKTQELLTLFGLPTEGEIFDTCFDCGYWPEISELRQWYHIDITDTEHWQELIPESIWPLVLTSVTGLYDQKGKPISEEIIDEIKAAYNDACVSGMESVLIRRLYETLETILESFSDYDYEYTALGDYGYVSYHGEAKGIEFSIIDYELTHIEANPDMVHVINDCLAGYGTFYPCTDIDGENWQEYVESRVHWLKYYWEIYGARKPELDYNNIDEFDESYFQDRLYEIEQEYKVTIR